MPRILGVHGIAQQYGSAPQLGHAWWLAIRGGLEAANHREAAETLSQDDVRVAFYGELFRLTGSKAGDGPPYSAEHVKTLAELELLEAWYQHANAEEPEADAGMATKGPARAAVQIMLNRLLRTPTFAGMAERAFIRDLKQVTAFLTNTTTKERVLQRVADELSADTRVLIGHSLGSVVAYEYLARFAPPQIELLITVGSPLGIPRLVFDRLTPSPVQGVGAWPGAVTRWVNIADENDLVALTKRIAPLFAATNGAQGPEDYAVDNGKNPHGIEPYLTTAAAGHALATVL